MIGTILVPTDGSEGAGKAVSFAAELAGRHEARLILLHVMPPGEVPEALQHLAEAEYHVEPEARTTGPRMGYFQQAAPSREARAAIADQVLTHAGRLAREGGAKRVETISEEGDPTAQILDYAAREEADMIVMGSRGLGDLKGLALGSVSHKVSHMATCTCVTVR